MTAAPPKQDKDAKPIRPRGRAPEVHFCRECGAPFWPRRFDQEFCGETHRRAWHRRKEARGAELHDLALEWRRKRPDGTRPKGGLSRVTSLVDGWLAEERRREAEHAAIRQRYRQQQQEVT